MSARTRARAWRVRRALRAAVKVDNRLARLSAPQPARFGDSSPSPRPRAGRLALRIRAGALARLLSHPRATEAAALVVGVTVGVVLVAVLLGTILAATLNADTFTPGGEA